MDKKERPWESEESFAYWTDEATGLTCMVLRHPTFLVLNGYVRLPKGSPLEGVHYTDDTMSSVSIHGGITFTGKMVEEGKCVGFSDIYADSDDGVNMDGHWIGFDTCHAGDYSPAMALEAEQVSTLLFGNPKSPEMKKLKELMEKTATEGLYRTMEYVMAETEDLAAQVLALHSSVVEVAKTADSMLKAATSDAKREKSAK